MNEPGRCELQEVHHAARFNRLSHSLYECKYHIVFCPKYRYRILYGEVAEFTEREIRQLCKQKDRIEILESISS